MNESHIIPVSSGLFEHKDRIGPAIWEFIWCIDAVTDEEVGDDGERWGIVLAGEPIKHETIASAIGSSERTVKRNMAILKAANYISTVRVNYGEIIKVRNNKKEIVRSAKNGTSHPVEVPKMAHLNETDGTKMAHLDESAASDVPEMAYLPSTDVPNLAYLTDSKDLKDLKALKDLNLVAVTAAVTALELNPGSNLTEEESFLLVVNAFCEIHNKIDTQINGEDRDLMHRMIAQGVSAPLITKVMRQVNQERAKRGKKIHSFSYYRDAIQEAWTNGKAPTTPDQAQIRDVAAGTTRHPKAGNSIGLSIVGPAVPSATDTRVLIEQQEILKQRKQEMLRKRAEERPHGT